MNIKTSANWKLALALAAAAALAACGGGSDNNDNEPAPRVSTVKVVGDSLSDSGTFGLKATVQTSADDVLWVERIAKSYDLAPLCPVYKLDKIDEVHGMIFTSNPQPGCTNFAIGGGRINNTFRDGGAEGQLSVLRQLRDAATVVWNTTDLLVADGGGNDAADLVAAYMNAPDYKGPSYVDLLSTLLPAAVLDQVLPSSNGPETTGGLYMQALAEHFAAGIRADGLDKGLQQALVANIPTITYTPRFQAVLALIEQAAGAERRAQAEGLFKSWVNAFNDRLAEKFAEEPRVKVMDVATRFTAFVAQPQNYGLSNVTLPVCGAEWIPPAIVPHRQFTDCTAAALTATPPPPGTPSGGDWWQHFLFSDGFHPTPYGHQLMGEQAIELLGQADWR